MVMKWQAAVAGKIKVGHILFEEIRPVISSNNQAGSLAMFRLKRKNPTTDFSFSKYAQLQFCRTTKMHFGIAAYPCQVQE